jgi:hypothetical protein
MENNLNYIKRKIISIMNVAYLITNWAKLIIKLTWISGS